MRQRIVLILVCLGLVGCVVQSPVPASRITPAKSGTLRYMHLPNVDVRHVPTLMALDDLHTQGYTIERTSLASSTLVVDALTRGEADIGLANTETVWTAIAKGAPIRTVLQFTRQTTLLVTRREIQDCHALTGKSIGLASTTGLSPTLFKKYLNEKCGDPQIEKVVMSESAARTAAMLRGVLDGTLMPGEELVKLQEQAPDRFHALVVFSDEFPFVLIDGIHVNHKWASEHPPIVRDYVRALLKANRAVTENPQLLYDEAVKRLKIESDTAKMIADIHLRNRIWDANGGITKDNVQYTLDLLIGTNALKGTLNVNDVADLAYLNEVLDEMGRK